MDPNSITPGISPGGVLEQGATATLPNQDAMHQHAQQLIQALIQSRLGPGGGLTKGPEAAKPNLPLPPTHTEGPGIAQGPFGSVGQRQRADKQALFGTIKGLVDKAEDKHYQMKVQKIQHDFETLSGAIKGYNEGQQSGDQDQMKHNADIINSIVMDPKKSKELSKAFDVNMNPMADDKKKEKPNPANDALKAAFGKDTKSFQSGQSMLAPQAQAMMRAMPQTLQADPRTLIMEQMTKSGLLPKAGEQLTFESDMMKVQKDVSNNKVTNDTRDTIARLFTGAHDRATQATLIKTAMQIQGAKERMDTLQKMWNDRADKLLQGVKDRTQVMKDKLDMSKGNKDDKLINSQVTALKNSADSLNKQLEDARKNHDVQKMAQISQQLESVGMMQQIVQGEIARRLNLNPDDFNQDQEQYKMSPEEQAVFNTLFQGTEEQHAPTE